MNDCVFCKIVKGEIPSKKEYEDKDVLAFDDINPVAPTHVLVIPKKHIKNLASAVPKDQAVLGRMQTVVSKLSKELGIDRAFRLIMANGEGAGQSVHHLHYHLIGGWKETQTEEDFKKDNQPGGLR